MSVTCTKLVGSEATVAAAIAEVGAVAWKLCSLPAISARRRHFHPFWPGPGRTSAGPALGRTRNLPMCLQHFRFLKNKEEEQLKPRSSYSVLECSSLGMTPERDCQRHVGGWHSIFRCQALDLRCKIRTFPLAFQFHGLCHM
jgi:hypothetical protein